MAMLMVDRSQLVEGIRVLDGMVKRKREARATLKFADGMLSIKIANTSVDVHAAGDWSGAAKIAAQMLFITVSSPPSADPVTLTVERDRFFIERRSTLCEWVESKRARSTPPSS
jgi:hypothetical protein